MPKFRHPGPYRLYRDARAFWRSKAAWEFTRRELESVFHSVESAAKDGDWGAKSLLAHFYLRGLGPLESNRVLEPNPAKAVDIIKSAVEAGQAWGYYDLGVAYENGYGGVPYDIESAWAYYRRAAELGSPDAQMALAQAYTKAKKWNEADAMMICAFNQGHGQAALELATDAEVDKKFDVAVRYYQRGTAFGSEACAAALMLIFDAEVWSRADKADQDTMKRMKILPDPERSRRYKEILHALKINPDLRLTRLDLAVPLPPEKLPNWTGVHDALESVREEVAVY